MKKIFSFLMVAICCFGINETASAQKIKSFKNIDWLEGKWMMEGKKGDTYEIWKMVDENHMSGKSFKVYKKDTTMRETIELVKENDNVFYIVTVKDQNNGEPVRYTMTDGNHRHMDFSNPEHDFPKEINYQWKQNDRYEVEIIGPLKPGSKKNKVILFSFKKQS
ncbi:MAG: DUF6265 family protein [Bacteroidota bacterium]